MPDIEKIKREGVALNLKEMAWQGYRAVSPDDQYRLKTLGVCSQRQTPQLHQGDGRYMLRIKIPFGQVRPAQLVCLAELAEQYGRGWGHLTTRQGLELHSVRLEDIPTIFEKMEAVGLTTKAACGDTIRNVVTCEHTGLTPLTAPGAKRPQRGEIAPLFDARPWALLIQNHFLELGPDNLNLPRKMNVYVTGCPDCIGHARINDLGLVASTRRRPDGSIEHGFALWIAGGLGANPRMGQQLRPFLTFQEVLPALEAVVRLYIDHGSRRSRATSKLKFLVEEWGMGRFSQLFEQYFGQTLPRFNSVPLPIIKRDTNTGKLPTKQEEVSVNIPGGEIRSSELFSLSELCKMFGEGSVYFTKEQNVCFKNLDRSEALELRTALVAAGFQVEGAMRIDDVLACPGTEFCPVAATPSLSAGARISRRFHQLISGGHLPPEVQRLRIHISGCPNSCAQHQVADIGLSGTRVHKKFDDQSGLGYQLFLGGTLEGTGRLAMLVHYGVPDELLEDTLLEVLNYYQRERLPGEKFPQYVGRVGQEVWEERLDTILDSLVERQQNQIAV